MASERSGTLLGRAVLTTQSDERLVRLTRDGHDAAYEEIVRRYRPRLVRQAATIVPPHRAEDVVQESLTKALAAIRSNDSRIALAAWLATIVRNRSLNDLRDEPGPHEELDSQYDGVPQPPAVAAERQEVRDVVEAIGALPEAQRKALVGRELEGRSHDEIASELGLTKGAARGLIFRARSGLRDTLGVLIPLPAVRFLTELGTAEATGGAAAGAGAAAAGMSAGTKATVGVLAVLATVGSTIAIERSGDERDGGSDGTPRAEAAAPGDRADRNTSEVTEASPPDRRDGGGEENEGDDDGTGEEREADGDNSGPGGGDDGPDHDDRSGPGGGGDDAAATPPAPAATPAPAAAGAQVPAAGTAKVSKSLTATAATPDRAAVAAPRGPGAATSPSTSSPTSPRASHGQHPRRRQAGDRARTPRTSRA